MVLRPIRILYSTLVQSSATGPVLSHWSSPQPLVQSSAPGPVLSCLFLQTERTSSSSNHSAETPANHSAATPSNQHRGDSPTLSELRVQLQQQNQRKTAKALFSPAPAKPAPSSVSLSLRGGGSASPASPEEVGGAERPAGGRRKRGGGGGGERRGRTKSHTLSLVEEPRVDVSRLDIRIGRILSVRRHPLAETLSVQGVASQARLLCCSAADDHIEMLAPPPGSNPGDRVTFNNYPGEPDRELAAKDRLWDLLQPDLRTDGRGVANYKGAWFEVKGKGLCRAPTLTNCSIH
ncbi:hypothetical protein CRUP_029435 [Coryphaenoides rupestris]|nr:hypothetical protein CRUP_029435 [Coryphaenoides rupestris]